MMDRRTVLETVGVAATLGVSAGCSVLDGSGGDGMQAPPSHRWWATADGNGVVSYTYVDLPAAGGFTDGRLLAQQRDRLRDPFFGLPMFGGASIRDPLARLTKFRLGGLVDLVNSASAYDSGIETPEETDIDGAIRTDAGVALSGEIHTDEIRETLTSEPVTELGQQYEERETVGGMVVYGPISGDGGPAIAVGEAGIVVPTASGGGVSTLRGVTDRYADDEREIVDEFERFAGLLDHAGGGGIERGLFAVPAVTDRVEGDQQRVGFSSYDSLPPVTGLAVSLDMSDAMDTVEGALAATLDEARAEAFGNGIGGSAAESSVDVDGGTVRATATWREP